MKQVIFFTWPYILIFTIRPILNPKHHLYHFLLLRIWENESSAITSSREHLINGHENAARAAQGYFTSGFGKIGGRGHFYFLLENIPKYLYVFGFGTIFWVFSDRMISEKKRRPFLFVCFGEIGPSTVYWSQNSPEMMYYIILYAFSNL